MVWMTIGYAHYGSIHHSKAIKESWFQANDSAGKSQSVAETPSVSSMDQKNTLFDFEGLLNSSPKLFLLLTPGRNH
jgi:hypothetical protein